MSNGKNIEFDELFNTFYTLDGTKDEKEFVDALRGFNKTAQFKLDYCWVAVLSDGRVISHFDREGEHLFREVLEAGSPVKTFGLIPVNGGVSHWVELPKGVKLIHYRQHHNTFISKKVGNRVLLRDKLKTHVLVYVFGFEKLVDGENKQWLRFVKGNGEYADTNDFHLDFK